MKEDIPVVQLVTPNPTLAIHGGKPVREEPMPVRMALGDAEIKMLNQAIAYYCEQKVDPGYQGAFEKLYTDAFVNMMNGGYADAVATGTAALYVAIAALDLPKGSEVLVSPITDPGTLSAIVLNGLKPRLMDSQPESYNIGVAYARHAKKRTLGARNRKLRCGRGFVFGRSRRGHICKVRVRG